jgi:hypothetical protein
VYDHVLLLACTSDQTPSHIMNLFEESCFTTSRIDEMQGTWGWKVMVSGRYIIQFFSNWESSTDILILYDFNFFFLCHDLLLLSFEINNWYWLSRSFIDIGFHEVILCFIRKNYTHTRGFCLIYVKKIELSCLLIVICLAKTTCGDGSDFGLKG